jgi:hypothetical protein
MTGLPAFDVVHYGGVRLDDRGAVGAASGFGLWRVAAIVSSKAPSPATASPWNENGI